MHHTIRQRYNDYQIEMGIVIIYSRLFFLLRIRPPFSKLCSEYKKKTGMLRPLLLSLSLSLSFIIILYFRELKITSMLHSH